MSTEDDVVVVVTVVVVGVAAVVVVVVAASTTALAVAAPVVPPTSIVDVPVVLVVGDPRMTVPVSGVWKEEVAGPCVVGEVVPALVVPIPGALALPVLSVRAPVG